MKFSHRHFATVRAFFLLLSCNFLWNYHTGIATFSSQFSVSPSSCTRPLRPCGAPKVGHSLIMCETVWVAPHWQVSEGLDPVIFWKDWVLPQPVRRWLSRTHAFRGRVCPGGVGEGVATKACRLVFASFHSSCHLMSIHVSETGPDLKRSAALVAKCCLVILWGVFCGAGMMLFPPGWSAFSASLRIWKSRLTFGGWTPDSTGSISLGVGFMVPEMMRIASLRTTSTDLVWTL